MIASLFPNLWSRRSLVGAAILVLGLAGFFALAAARSQPDSISPPSQVLSSKAIRATPSSVQMFLSGFGEIKPLRQVEIGSDVSGRIVDVHPDLRPGAFVRAGDLLFAVDPSDFASRVAELEADVALASNAAARIAVDGQAKIERLSLSSRNLDLADANLARIRSLFDANGVGSLADVESAERDRNALADLVRSLRADVDLLPIEASDAARRADSAAAALARARNDLARCRVAAPFDARVVSSSVETHQWVSPGSPLVVLADDSVREIVVSLDSSEARDRLVFDSDSPAPGGWFPAPARVPCRVFLSSDPSAPHAVGTLHRVVHVDRDTRMLSVAVRLQAADAPAWPAADGMFCRVEIPGRVVSGVFALPRHAFNPRGFVYRAVDGILHSTPVRLVHSDRDSVFVDQGLSDGDLVLVSRLANPLDLSPVSVLEVSP